MNQYDVIVIGGGHAGIEASLACARLHCKTLVITLKKEAIGLMSCNPAIGGVGKSQLVREIDALGGQMAKAADICGIQFRMLNASKGQAVQSLRAQIDMDAYKYYIQGVLNKQDNLEIKEAEVTDLIVEDSCVKGVITREGSAIYAKSVVVTPGTFLDGIIHVGLSHYSAGRINEHASVGFTENLRKLGLNILRFKTGTCPRIDKDSIDFSRLKAQDGDINPACFSFSTVSLAQKQIPCYLTYTNLKTHKIIRDNLDRSPLYTGAIKATGVRYCPSIEDKIVKFCDKDRHQVFLEPVGRDTAEIYPNGLSTSLPEDVQLEMVRSVYGLENAKILRFGYGIEYSVVEPTQLYPTLEAKTVKGLFFAGQINGTTGYEEAAAQGLIAGINAACVSTGREPFILDRASSYIGVLIDDLTTKGTLEPYRMFTSRVEYRLILRQDNADLRLGKKGFELGLVALQVYDKLSQKIQEIKKGIVFLKETRVKPAQEINKKLEGLGTAAIRKSTALEELLRRPQINLQVLREICNITDNDIPEIASQEVEIEVKYAGFMQKQRSEVEKFKNLEKIRIPLDMDYSDINGLSREIKEKLSKLKPLNLGQASRISGITPAAVSLLMVFLRKAAKLKTGNAD